MARKATCLLFHDEVLFQTFGYVNFGDWHTVPSETDFFGGDRIRNRLKAELHALRVAEVLIPVIRGKRWRATALRDASRDGDEAFGIFTGVA